MTARVFTKKRLSNSIVVPAGVSSVTVPVSFVPDFIQVKFHDFATNALPNTLTHAFNATGDPEAPYELMISWTTRETRTIRYVVAELPTSSEQTIAFGFS